MYYCIFTLLFFVPQTVPQTFIKNPIAPKIGRSFLFCRPLLRAGPYHG